MIDYGFSLGLNKVDDIRLGVIKKEVELLSDNNLDPILDSLLNEAKEEVRKEVEKRQDWDK